MAFRRSRWIPCLLVLPALSLLVGLAPSYDAPARVEASSPHDQIPSDAEPAPVRHYTVSSEGEEIFSALRASIDGLDLVEYFTNLEENQENDRSDNSVEIVFGEATVTSEKLSDWWEKARSGTAEKRELQIQLEEDRALPTFSIEGTFTPVWTPGSFDGKSSDVLVEEITIVCEDCSYGPQ